MKGYNREEGIAGGARIALAQLRSTMSTYMLFFQFNLLSARNSAISQI
jgi:hypothetical protein